jgi:hypothetical protein
MGILLNVVAGVGIVGELAYFHTKGVLVPNLWWMIPMAAGLLAFFGTLMRFVSKRQAWTTPELQAAYEADVAAGWKPSNIRW